MVPIIPVSHFQSPQLANGPSHYHPNAGSGRCVGRVISGVCDFNCVSVRVRVLKDKRRAINTKLGLTDMLCGRNLSCIDPELEKVKGQGHRAMKSTLHV